MNPDDVNPDDEDHETLDLRGLKCPLPALMAKRALLRSRPGASILVLADDPLAAIDIPHMCHQEGFEVANIEKNENSSGITIKRLK